MSDNSFKCLECDDRFGTMTAFSQHIRRIHNVSKETYYRHHALNDIEPVCACGCGEIITRFYDLRVGYPLYVFGHQGRSAVVHRVITPLFDDVQVACSLCDERFAYAARLERHLSDVHQLTLDQHYVNVYRDGVYPTCECGCGGRLTFYDWQTGFPTRYVRGHQPGAPQTRESIEKGIQARKQGFAEGRYSVWNDGLTKDTDVRVADMSKKASITKLQRYASGEIVPWQKGLTKETSESVARSTYTRVSRLHAGEIRVWNDGLTKESDERLADIGQKIAAAYDQRDIGRRVSSEEFKRRISKYPWFECLNPDDYRSISRTKLLFKCNVCGNVHEKSLNMLESTPVCFVCHPKGSYAQIQIFEFVRSLGVDAIDNDRTAIAPKEIDVYVPSRRFGIEYNGLYWHSERFAGIDAHRIKHDMANVVGVNLLSIYEDEWRDKRSIVEGMIRHRLGLSEHKVHARQCDVVELNVEQRRAFFDLNHLEGDVQAKFALGLIERSSGVLVAAASFRRPFHRKYAGSLELARSAPLLNHNVRGWLGRLMSSSKLVELTSDVSDIVSYVDNRVGSGNAYAAAGFTLVKHETAPRFWWTDFVNRFNRFEFRAVDGKTQRDVASEAGVCRIFGCANSLWRYSIKRNCEQYTANEVALLHDQDADVV